MASKKKSEEPLKALVFVDNCNGITKEINLAKDTKLHNIPILTWQLKALSRYGVQIVILLAFNPINNFDPSNFPELKIQVVSSPSWTSEGDALRELEARDDLRPVDDFILIRQGAIFNLKADELIASHRKRREQDRNWLISTAFRKSSPDPTSDLVIVREQKAGTLVSYFDQPLTKGVTINSASEHTGLTNGGTVEVLSNILDVGVDVCSPEFLLEFRENFQFDHVRAYIKDKLEGGEAEVFGNRMYAHILDTTNGEYATRITSLHSLLQTSEDITNGWMRPITVDDVADRHPRYVSEMEYEEFQVVDSTVASTAEIGVGSLVENSVIGENVVIGVDCTIRDSIIGESSKIGDSSDIERCIVSKGVGISNHVRIPSRCFIDENAYLNMSMRLEPGSLITMKDPKKLRIHHEDDVDSMEDEMTNKMEDFNENGLGRETTETTESESQVQSHDDEELTIIVGTQAAELDYLFRDSSKAITFYESEAEDEYEVSEMTEEDEKIENIARRDTYSNGSDNDLVTSIAEGVDEVNLNADDNRIANFNKEVLETIFRAHHENTDIDNTMLELSSLKSAYESSPAETLSGILYALGSVARRHSTDETLYGEVKNILNRYAEPTLKFSDIDDVPYGTTVVTGLANALRDEGILLKYLLTEMYEADIVSDESILEWASCEREQVEANLVTDDLLLSLEDLLTWLAEDDEESDD